MRTAGPKPHSKPPSKLLAAWLGLAGVLMAIPWSSGTDIDPAAAEMSEMLGALTDEMVTEHAGLLDLDGNLAEIVAGAAETKRTCSRAGMARALAKMEALYSKPWELCPSCGGDLLHMFELICFDSKVFDLVQKRHPTKSGEYIPGTMHDISKADPEGIRKLLTAKEALKLQSWGEAPASLCMVGCLPGYRPERTVKTAMLAYECQNISVVGDIKVDGTMRSGDHGIMPVPGTMRSPSWEPPRGNPRGFTPGEIADLKGWGAALGVGTDEGWHGLLGEKNPYISMAGLPGAGLPAEKVKKGKKGKQGKKGGHGGTGVAVKGHPVFPMWRCISGGSNLKGVDLLHGGIRAQSHCCFAPLLIHFIPDLLAYLADRTLGGMPCSEQFNSELACKRPNFDMGRGPAAEAAAGRQFPPAVAAAGGKVRRPKKSKKVKKVSLSASAIVADQDLHKLSCMEVHKNPWALFGYPVAGLCAERCLGGPGQGSRNGPRGAAAGGPRLGWFADMLPTFLLSLAQSVGFAQPPPMDVPGPCTIADLVPCGNERVQSLVVEWSWTGPIDPRCDSGEPWQMYAVDPEASGAVSCRDLDPLGFLHAYYPADIVGKCASECPSKWLRLPRPFETPNKYGGPATRDKKTRELRAGRSGLFHVPTDRTTSDQPPQHFDTRDMVELGFGPTPTALRQQVKDIYMKYEPAQAVAALPALYKKYSGDERRLLALVAAKFGLGPKPAATKPSNGDAAPEDALGGGPGPGREGSALLEVEDYELEGEL